MQISNVLLDFPFPKERVFRYQAMQDILHHLANNPFEEFTQQELASMTGADVSSISRSVELLEKLGVIVVSEQRPARITIDGDHLQASEDLNKLVAVVLFGSVARGTADRRSDIDLLVIVDGDLTYGRRICPSLARDIEEESFDGHRYEFEVLVETPDTAVSHGEDLQEIFDEGLVVDRSDRLQELCQNIYASSGEGGTNAE